MMTRIRRGRCKCEPNAAETHNYHDTCFIFDISIPVHATRIVKLKNDTLF